MIVTELSIPPLPVVNEVSVIYGGAVVTVFPSLFVVVT